MMSPWFPFVILVYIFAPAITRVICVGVMALAPVYQFVGRYSSVCKVTGRCAYITIRERLCNAVAYDIVVRLVSHVPCRVKRFFLMQGRSLHSCKTSFCYVGYFSLYVTQFPVEAMQYHAILNIVFKSLFVVGEDVGCKGKEHQQHQYTSVRYLFHKLILIF